jgi:hypothetical protein
MPGESLTDTSAPMMMVGSLRGNRARAAGFWARAKLQPMRFRSTRSLATCMHGRPLQMTCKATGALCREVHCSNTDTTVIGTYLLQ